MSATATFQVMGTVVSFTSPHPAAPSLVADVRRILGDADARFSPYRPDSELRALHRDPELPVSPDMVDVLSGARFMEVTTDGWFRPRDGRGRVETTGYVKGWAMRRCENALRAADCADFLLVVGGDIVAAGRNGDRPWHVAVRHPAQAGAVAEVLAVSDGAVATSGDYERGDHVWGRRTGRRGGSVTVVGPRIDVADALATALWAADDPQPGWLHRFADYTALWLHADGTTRAA